MLATSIWCPVCDELRPCSLEHRRRVERGEAFMACTKCSGSIVLPRHRWWLERFEMDEIRTMGAALETFLDQSRPARSVLPVPLEV